MDKTQKKSDENFEKFKADSGIKLDPIEEEAAREKFSFGRSTLVKFFYRLHVRPASLAAI